MGCVSQDFCPTKNLFHMISGNWDQDTPSNSPQTPGTKSKFGEGRVHREELSKSVNLMWGDFPTRKMRSQSRVGFGEKYLQAQDGRQSCVFVPYWIKGCGAYSQLWSAYQRGSRSIRSRSVSIPDSAFNRGNVSSPITWETLRRTRISLWDIFVSGSAVRSHGWPKRGRQLNAKRTISYLLSFQEVLEAISRQHRHRRICQHVQLKSEVTN